MASLQISGILGQTDEEFHRTYRRSAERIIAGLSGAGGAGASAGQRFRVRRLGGLERGVHAAFVQHGP